MKRVLILNESEGALGGAESAGAQFYKHMSRHSINCIVTKKSLFCRENGLLKSNNKLTGIFFLPLNFFYFVRFLKTNKFDFVVANNFASILFVYFTLLLSSSNVVFYSWVHTNFIHYESQQKGLKKIYVKLIRIALSRSNKIIVVSDEQVDIMRGSGFADVVNISNFCKLVESKNELKKIKSIYKAPNVPKEEGANLLYVGRLSKEKRVDRLLRCIPHLLCSARLTIVGDGPILDELVLLSKTLGIQDQVDFVGMVEDVRELYLMSDILLLSSDIEGFPLVLQEAAIYGLPVVSSDIQTGPREFLCKTPLYDVRGVHSLDFVDGGILINPFEKEYDIPKLFANAIDILVKDTDMYTSMSRYIFGLIGEDYNSKIVNDWDSTFN